MSEKLVVPAFESEADEAQWWFENQEGLGDDIDRAFEDGTIGRGSAVKRVLALREELIQNGIVPEPADIAKARRVAEKKGLAYEVYVRQLIHRGLEQELMADNEHAAAA